MAETEVLAYECRGVGQERSANRASESMSLQPRQGFLHMAGGKLGGCGPACDHMALFRYRQIKQCCEGGSTEGALKAALKIRL